MTARLLSCRLSRLARTGVALVLVVSGCARATTAAVPSPGPSLAQTLHTWDTADSTASAHNDLAALRAAETGPALAFSVAGANAARITQHPQAEYQHIAPTFVALTGEPSCVLAAASVKLAGEEIALPDFSEFHVSAGTWMLTNHILLARSVSASTTDLAGATAISAADAVTADRQSALSAELFSRTIGSKWSAAATIAPSTLIDRQLLGGWQVYTQQMAKYKVAVTRTLNSTTWSQCAAHTAQGALIFLTMSLTDKVAPAASGPRSVSLPATSPDLQSLGLTSARSGATISIQRLESFVLQIPANAAVPVQVVGMSDAPTALTTT